MGWGEKAIELRSVETGNLEGVFMHKKAQKLKFLCERNDKVQRWLQFGDLAKMSNSYDRPVHFGNFFIGYFLPWYNFSVVTDPTKHPLWMFIMDVAHMPTS